MCMLYIISISCTILCMMQFYRHCYMSIPSNTWKFLHTHICATKAILALQVNSAKCRLCIYMVKNAQVNHSFQRSWTVCSPSHVQGQLHRTLAGSRLVAATSSNATSIGWYMMALYRIETCLDRLADSCLQGWYPCFAVIHVGIYKFWRSDYIPSMHLVAVHNVSTT